MFWNEDALFGPLNSGGKVDVKGDIKMSVDSTSPALDQGRAFEFMLLFFASQVL